jgi:DNA repair protein RadC
MQIELTEDQKIKIMNSDDVYQVMKKILLRENKVDQDKEHFWVICLSASYKIINIELVSLGGLDGAIIKPMQVFRIGIMKGAVRMVLVHNHPSENLTPSEDDKDITDRLIQVGNIVGVEVVEHLIISLEEYFSFERTGLLGKLKLSKKWVPRFIEEERLRKEKEKLRKEAKKIGKKEGIKEGKKIGKQIGLEKGIQKGKKEGLKEGKIEMAKKLKEKGIETDIITETSGLSKEEIEKL